MQEALAPRGVTGLNHQRVQRPEASFGHAEELASPEPREREQGANEQHRAQRARRRRRECAEPDRRHDRNEAQQDGGDHRKEDERYRQLRETDLGEETAGEREEGAMLEAGYVGLDVAVARIDQWF